MPATYARSNRHGARKKLPTAPQTADAAMQVSSAQGTAASRRVLLTADRTHAGPANSALEMDDVFRLEPTSAGMAGIAALERNAQDTATTA
jgi:hypothetical protein